MFLILMGVGAIWGPVLASFSGMYEKTRIELRVKREHRFSRFKGHLLHVFFNHFSDAFSKSIFYGFLMILGSHFGPTFSLLGNFLGFIFEVNFKVKNGTLRYNRRLGKMASQGGSRSSLAKAK